jgi:hypothetical protein
MWPREVFDTTVETDTGRKRLLARTLDTILQKPGVYILYRDDVPHYIGQATRMRSRLLEHANNPNMRHYNFWNFFSAFMIEDKKHRDQIEAILIAAMPTANSARPNVERQRLPKEVIELLREIRRRRANPVT